MKKILILVVISIIVAIGGYKYAMRPVADTSNAEAKYNATFADVDRKMTANDTISLNTYTNQIISISGNVKTITKSDASITISMGDSVSMNTVECQIDSRHQSDFVNVKENEPINMKGVCAGCNIDEMGLGGSLQLKNCVINK